MHNTGAMPDSEGSRPGVFLRTFQAFRYRDYRLVWIGACTSAIGTWMQTTAQAWLVLTLTNSPFYLGLIGFLSQLPVVLLSLLGGAAAIVWIGESFCSFPSTARWSPRSS